jgi:peptidoglycan-associated lipoprotein
MIFSPETSMTRRTLAISFTVLCALSAVQSCRRQPQPAPTPAATPTDDAASRRRADSLAAAQRRSDSLAAAQAATARDAAAGDAQRAQAELSTILAQKVYFDFDRDQLRDDAIAVLDQKAAVLLANPAVTLVVTGHTDERGTAEYNLALGQRRAAQVKRYLTSKGVTDDRLTTRSLGDSQPAAQGTDEAAYQQNRRAEFDVRNVRGALVRPRA